MTLSIRKLTNNDDIRFDNHSIIFDKKRFGTIGRLTANTEGFFIFEWESGTPLDHISNVRFNTLDEARKAVRKAFKEAEV